MKKILISILLCGVIGMTLSGCGFIDGFKKGFDDAANKNDTTQTSNTTKESAKKFKDKDGKFQISTNDNWSESDEVKKSNPKFCIGVVNKANETYAGIIEQSKLDFTNNMTLDKYNELIIQGLKKSLTNCEISDIKDTEINGYKAKTFLAKGTIKEIKFSYVYSVIELPDSFVNVTSWTFTSHFDKNKDELTKVTNSFQKLK